MAKSKKSKKKVINDFDRDDLGNIIGNKNLEGRDLQKFVLTNPTTGEEYEFDADALVGEDWTGMSQNADAIFSSEEIEKYYDKAIDMKLNEANDFPDGLGSEIKHDWIQEVWNKVNPGVKILSHSDKMKALACNTLYTFGSEEEHNQDLLYSFWPRPGRQVVFDSRIPNMERPVNGDKSCVSLVFQGTNKGYTPESTDDVVEEIDYSEVDFSEVK